MTLMLYAAADDNVLAPTLTLVFSWFFFLGYFSAKKLANSSRNTVKTVRIEIQFYIPLATRGILCNKLRKTQKVGQGRHKVFILAFHHRFADGNSVHEVCLHPAFFKWFQKLFSSMSLLVV